MISDNCEIEADSCERDPVSVTWNLNAKRTHFHGLSLLIFGNLTGARRQCRCPITIAITLMPCRMRCEPLTFDKRGAYRMCFQLVCEAHLIDRYHGVHAPCRSNAIIWSTYLHLIRDLLSRTVSSLPNFDLLQHRALFRGAECVVRACHSHSG